MALCSMPENLQNNHNDVRDQFIDKCKEGLVLPSSVYHSDSIIWNNFHHSICHTVQVYQITTVAVEDEKILLLEHRFLGGIYSTSLTPMRSIAQFFLLNVMVTNHKQETTHNSQQHNDGFSTIPKYQWKEMEIYKHAITQI